MDQVADVRTRIGESQENPQARLFYRSFDTSELKRRLFVVKLEFDPVAHLICVRGRQCVDIKRRVNFVESEWITTVVQSSDEKNRRGMVKRMPKRLVGGLKCENF
ncbi:hypothetical protein JTE90_000338 [Oedothorax gibbosus]|uniref:Uncharacterized protein n=1 Tax=Oedothorax gibbosus TaxID=931172 RepID=A0AAV6TZT2_9ARAC|nr:hypothetical protein JTE90_000338 [Oedothorax gibbosus]